MTKGVDEKLWSDAVKAFKKQYNKDPDTDRDFSIVASLYQKMGGDFDVKELKEDLTMDSPFTTIKLPEVVEPAKEEDVDSKELAMGIEVELEHTNDREEAKKIALQHLAEVPDYYTKLKKHVEPKMERLNKLCEKVDFNKYNKAIEELRRSINESDNPSLKREADKLLSQLTGLMRNGKESASNLLDLANSIRASKDMQTLLKYVKSKKDITDDEAWKIIGKASDYNAANVDDAKKAIDKVLQKESLSPLDKLYESVCREKWTKIRGKSGDIHELKVSKRMNGTIVAELDGQVWGTYDDDGQETEDSIMKDLIQHVRTEESLSPLDKLHESVCKEGKYTPSRWEGNGWIIEKDGKPFTRTMPERDAREKAKKLNSGEITEIQAKESLKIGDKVHSPSGYAKVISVKGNKVIVRSNDPAGDFEYDMKDVRKESVCKENDLYTKAKKLWDGATDSKSPYALARRKGMSHEDAVIHAVGKSRLESLSPLDKLHESVCREGAVPKPFNENDIVEFTTDIYQISDTELYDIEKGLNKTGKDGFVLQDDARVDVRGDITNAKRYESFIKTYLERHTEKLYFKINTKGEKAIIKNGANANDVILAKVKGGTFGAYDKNIVKYLKKVN